VPCRLAQLGLLVLLSSGCHLIFPFDRSGTEVDARPGAELGLDAGPTDAASDAVPDVPLDLFPVDTGRDVASPFDTVASDGPQTPDLAPKDAAKPPDTAKPLDTKPQPDTAPPDTAPQPDIEPPPDTAPQPDTLPPPDSMSYADTVPSLACVAPATPEFSVSATGVAYVVCMLPANATVTQCGAAALCNSAAGFQLCPSSKYLAAFGVGKMVPPLKTNQYAWIGGCVREDTAPHFPSESPCQCIANNVGYADVTWDCTAPYTVMLQTGQSYLGLVTSPICQRVGENSAQYAAYWAVWPALEGTKAKGAVCCK